LNTAELLVASGLKTVKEFSNSDGNNK